MAREHIPFLGMCGKGYCPRVEADLLAGSGGHVEAVEDPLDLQAVGRAGGGAFLVDHAIDEMIDGGGRLPGHVAGFATDAETGHFLESA